MKGGGVTQPFGLKDIPPKTGNLGPKTLILALFGFFEFIGLFGLKFRAFGAFWAFGNFLSRGGGHLPIPLSFFGQNDFP